MLDLVCIDRGMYWEGSALVECTITGRDLFLAGGALLGGIF
jgi:hypothetical protein